MTKSDYHKYHQTLHDLYDLAPPRIKRRAEKYLDERRIRHLHLEDGLLVAYVQGSRPKPYKVEIHLDERRRSCTCPAHYKYRDIPCKHQTLATLPFIRNHDCG